MFALVIMTHGDNNRIFCSDGQEVELLEIYSLLSTTNFPAMAGKPKMVILQACAGG